MDTKIIWVIFATFYVKVLCKFHELCDINADMPMSSILVDKAEGQINFKLALINNSFIKITFWKTL